MPQNALKSFSRVKITQQKNQLGNFLETFISFKLTYIQPHMCVDVYKASA